MSCTPAPVRHLRARIDGHEVFYREAGAAHAPVLVLPHGYPCSSYEFRNLMPALADRWRLVAPDFPGSGYSDTPDGFAYDFDAHAAWLERFLDHVGVGRFAIWLHDFGGWIGLRLAMREPARAAALIIQNVDIYMDTLGPKYAFLLELFRNPTEENRGRLADAVSEEGFSEEFLNDVRPELAERIPPDLWRLHWSPMTPRRKEIAVRTIEGLKENFEVVPALPGIPAGASPSDPDPLGTPGRLHAGSLGAGLSARPAGRRGPHAGRRPLAPRGPARRGGRAHP